MKTAIVTGVLGQDGSYINNKFKIIKYEKL